MFPVQERHEQLKSLDRFVPINTFRYYFITKHSTTKLLHHLIYLAQNTQYFTLSTTTDCQTHSPSILQIEIIDKHESLIVLIETNYLPQDPTSLKYWLIRSLVRTVFKQNNMVYVWGNVWNRLQPFSGLHLFYREDMDQPQFINIQEEYRAFDYRLNLRYRNGNHPWSLQMAIANICNQYLDQRQTFNDYNQCFHRPVDSIHPTAQQPLIDYLVNQCLAVTRIAYILDRSMVSHFNSIKKKSLSNSLNFYFSSIDFFYSINKIFIFFFFYFRLNMNFSVDHNNTVGGCEHMLTYDEVFEILVHTTCAPNATIERIRRSDGYDEQTVASTNNIYALQSTINDHRTMIDDHRKMIHYLINNTVNVTHLNQYYADQHARSSPIWHSWRDLLLIILVFIGCCCILGFIIKQFHVLDRLTTILLRRREHKHKERPIIVNKNHPHPLPEPASFVNAYIREQYGS